MKRASDNLVKAAQKAAFDKSEDDSVVVKTKFVGGIAQVRKKKKNVFMSLGKEISPAGLRVIFSERLQLWLIC